MYILHPAIIEYLCMKIIDKIIESISGCLSLIFWVIVALVCVGILTLLS